MHDAAGNWFIWLSLRERLAARLRAPPTAYRDRLIKTSKSRRRLNPPGSLCPPSEKVIEIKPANTFAYSPCAYCSM